MGGKSPGSGSGSGPEFPSAPFTLSVEQLQDLLHVNVEVGLFKGRAQQLKAEHGENKLLSDSGVSWVRILGKQASNAMILVLLLAMAVSFGVQDWIEGGVISGVIVLNILVGFWQEFSAERRMDALRALSSPSAAVLRDGEIDTVPSAEVVVGDVVQIKTGDTVPADLRLFDEMNLETDEKILTGEALPVAKDLAVEYTIKGGNKGGDGGENGIETEIGIGDRLNMVYSSTIVTKGRGRGIVIATGMNTEIGKIAASMQGKRRKASRSMSRQKYGAFQPVKGAGLRTFDAIASFLGLTEGTPLQIKLNKLAYVLFACAIVLAIIVFGVNRFNVSNEVAVYAISTGIAIIPESLVAVLTLTMVVGMSVMRKRKVVTRQMSALESLGGITTICSDKTGTLTQGKMITKKVWIPGDGVYSVADTQDANNPQTGIITFANDKSRKELEEEQGERQAQLDAQRSASALKFDIPSTPSRSDTVDKTTKKSDRSQSDSTVDTQDIDPKLKAFLTSAALCNLSTVRYNDHERRWQTTGEPTEVALQVFASRFGLGKPDLRSQGFEERAEYPFDSSVKRMSVVYGNGSEDLTVFTKGAVERVLDLCTHVGTGNATRGLDEETKEKILDQMEFFADQGLRVLAVAQRTWNGQMSEHKAVERSEVEKDHTLLGLAGIYDPPREETKGAVMQCGQAGIKVHMLTGDHPGTAAAIAREVGILPRNTANLPHKVAQSLVLTAAEFDKMTDNEIDALPELPLVIARCAPDTKTRMIEALHRRGRYAAMTGDGVNDAPSLKAADVGIAMGLNGSDVAKSASKIVLTDDNFASIVSAIEEGRRLFDNIQKFVLHLLLSNVGEVVLLICGLAFQDSSRSSVFPLSPLQILWINMLTSSFPAFGLGREKPAWNVMSRPPHDNKKGVFTWQIITDMLVYGICMGTMCLMTFLVIVYGTAGGQLGEECNRYYSDSCDAVFRARAAIFAELTWMILVAAWEIKSLRRSLLRLDPHSQRSFTLLHDLYENRFLFFAVVIGGVSVFPAVYIPRLNTDVFKHKAISWEWGLSAGFTVAFVLAMELWKLVKRTTGWFRESDEEPRRGPLDLKQGFFSFAKTLSKERSFTGEKSVVSSSQTLCNDNRTPTGHEAV